MTGPEIAAKAAKPPEQAIQPGGLVAVVVTYNRLAKLKRTIRHLLDASEEALRGVLVFDNASTDGTGSWLAALDDPRLTIQTSPENLGGAGGFEQALRHAVGRFDADWYLLMDDDSHPAPGTLDRFAASPRDRFEAWAAAVYHPEGQICDINRPSRNPFWHPGIFLRMLRGHGRDGFHLCEEDYAGTDVVEVDVTSFVGLFLSRRAVSLAGYPDGRLFLYADDVLYSLALRQAGGRIGFDPALRFEHDFSALQAGLRRFTPLWKGYYYQRNLLIAYREAAGIFFWPLLLLVLPKWLWWTRDHPGERRAYLRLLFQAVRDGLLRRTSADRTALRSAYR